METFQHNKHCSSFTLQIFETSSSAHVLDTVTSPLHKCSVQLFILLQVSFSFLQ